MFGNNAKCIISAAQINVIVMHNGGGVILWAWFAANGSGHLPVPD